MNPLQEKAAKFRALHVRDRAFVIPNPWDVGTARLLAGLGFEALATTSAGFAFSLGRSDNAVSRAEMLAHIQVMANATTLPLSADLENGFGDTPDQVAETIRLAGASGLVGGSIEDATGRAGDPVYRFELAVERIRAAVQAAHALPFHFTLTARAENFIQGRPDLGDTIARLQAYQEAGADVLFAAGLSTSAEIAEVVRSVDRPVNVLMGAPGLDLTVDDLSAIGVKRISVGSAFSRAALGAFLAAANEVRDRGTFTFGRTALPYRAANQLFA